MAEYATRIALQTVRTTGWLSGFLDKNATVLVHFMKTAKLLQKDETCLFDMPLPEGGPDNTGQLPALLHVKVHSGLTDWGKSLRIAIWDVGRTHNILRLGWEACRQQICDENSPHGCGLIRAPDDGWEIYFRRHCLVRLIIEHTGVGWQTRWLEMDLFGDRDLEQ